MLKPFQPRFPPFTPAEEFNAMKRFAHPALSMLLVVACLPITLPRAAFGQRQSDNKNTAVVPVPRDGKWMTRHESFNERAKQGDVDLVFIGDSITQGWETNGKDVWKKHYRPRKAMNLGIGGDRTQHVLWRLDNGNIEGIKPKLAVIMIGTNNSNGDDYTADQIAEGIKAIVVKLRDKLPETKVLILGVFPRGKMSDAQLEKDVTKGGKQKLEGGELAEKIAAGRKYTKKQREKIADYNKSVAQLADNKSIYYLDIGPNFLDADGVIADDIMYDHLHLTPKGYQIWADAIEPQIKELMGEAADGKPDGRKAQNDSQRIQGTWNAVSYVADGESIDPKEAPVRWGFTDDTVTFFADVEEASARGKFKLNADKTPHAIDLNFAATPAGDKGQAILGIYEVTADRLKVCYGTEGVKRPSEFKSKAGSNLIEIVFKRVVM
jgi:uncharacterized protein (TIGR03067 family)